MIVEALSLGKDVFVEKPLAIDPDGLAKIEEAVRASGGRVMVGFNRRFAPMAVLMREHLASASPLGLLYRINAGRLPPGSWIEDPREGGGRIIGEVCHFVDFFQFLTGSQPREVFARSMGGGGVSATLTFADGSTGSILYVTSGDISLPKAWRHLEPNR